MIEGKESEEFAESTGQFHLSRDLPEAIVYWPSDFVLNVTYRLQRDRLCVLAQVENSGSFALPFGLGYHPYFRLAGEAEDAIDRYTLQANVNRLWETEENLPTGNRIAIPPDIDFRGPHAIGSTALNHVFTDVRPESVRSDGMMELAESPIQTQRGGYMSMPIPLMATWYCSYHRIGKRWH